MSSSQLLARVILNGEIETKTGLHIGGSSDNLAIGSVDMPVIRDARTNQPYIPGSSLKGKMRSLAEKWTGATQNKNIGKNVYIHVAENAGEYQKFWVNPLFGVPGEVRFNVPAPNRLIVRDIQMTEEARLKLLSARTDQPFTEVKWEAAIDRVTSAATPRQIERVPVGTIFGPLEMVLSLFLDSDVALLGNLLTAMQLLEDDYLGGQGSRGSGKIFFRNLQVTIRCGADYNLIEDPQFKDLSLPELIDRKQKLLTWVTANLPK